MRDGSVGKYVGKAPDRAYTLLNMVPPEPGKKILIPFSRRGHRVGVGPMADTGCDDDSDDDDAKDEGSLRRNLNSALSESNTMVKVYGKNRINKIMAKTA